MNFEQIKLQVHLQGLYQRLGRTEAEHLIARAVKREMDRYDRLQQLAPAPNTQKSCDTPSV